MSDMQPELERLRKIEKAARVYFREFDHLIGRRDYPERRDLREALSERQLDGSSVTAVGGEGDGPDQAHASSPRPDSTTPTAPFVDLVTRQRIHLDPDPLPFDEPEDEANRS